MILNKRSTIFKQFKRNPIPLILEIVSVASIYYQHFFIGVLCGAGGLVLSIIEHKKSEANYIGEIILNGIGIVLPIARLFFTLFILLCLLAQWIGIFKSS